MSNPFTHNASPPNSTLLYPPGHPAAGRSLAAFPRIALPGSIVPVVTEIIPIPPVPRWQTIDLLPHRQPTRDQGNQSSCVAYAATQALRTAARALGATYPGLSAGHLYGRINHGIDAGAWLADALIELTTRGAPDVAMIPDQDWHSGQSDPDVLDNAILHRILEFWDCPTPEAIMGAIQAGHPAAAAFDIGTNFNVDKNGWVLPKRGSAGGHAICLIGADRHPLNNEWGFLADNSWGKDWDIDGAAYIPMHYFRTKYTDAWAITSTLRT